MVKVVLAENISAGNILVKSYLRLSKKTSMAITRAKTIKMFKKFASFNCCKNTKPINPQERINPLRLLNKSKEQRKNKKRKSMR